MGQINLLHLELCEKSGGKEIAIFSRDFWPRIPTGRLLTGELVGGNVELFATNYVLADLDQTYLYA